MKWLSFPGTLALKNPEQWLSTTGQVAQPGAENPCGKDSDCQRTCLLYVGHAHGEDCRIVISITLFITGGTLKEL